MRCVLALMTLVLCGCGATSGDDAAGGGGATGTAGTGAAGGVGSGGAGVGGGVGVGGALSGSGGGTGTPVRLIPGLVGITFYERTGGTAPNAYPFTKDGPELTVRLPDPLTDASHDIPGAMSEFYDVYYSDADGNFELDGSYLTISGTFEQTLPAGGGLNLAEIGLEYEGAPTEFGNYVASYVALGDNKDETTVGACIDGDLQTNTTMGNTVGQAERLRLTLGFESSSGDPK
jgi:hypothetical protein